MGVVAELLASSAAPEQEDQLRRRLSEISSQSSSTFVAAKLSEAFEYVSEQLEQLTALDDIASQKVDVHCSFGMCFATAAQRRDALTNYLSTLPLIEAIEHEALQCYFIDDSPRCVRYAMRDLNYEEHPVPNLRVILTLQDAETLSCYNFHAKYVAPTKNAPNEVGSFVVEAVHNVGVQFTWTIFAVDEWAARTAAPGAFLPSIPLNLTVGVRSFNLNTRQRDAAKPLLDKIFPTLLSQLDALFSRDGLRSTRVADGSMVFDTVVPVLQQAARADDHFRVLQYVVEEYSTATVNTLNVETTNSWHVEYSASTAGSGATEAPASSSPCVYRTRSSRVMLAEEQLHTKGAVEGLSAVMSLYSHLLRTQMPPRTLADPAPSEPQL